MDKLKTSLTTLHCPPDLPEAIITHLNLWRDGKDATDIHTTKWTRLTNQLLQAQCDIGWDLLLLGCCSFKWAEVMELYLKNMGSKTTGIRWVSALIRKLWDTSWDMWDHRNTYLHKEKPDEELLGLEILNQHITSEYNLGTHHLMTPDETALFSRELHLILGMLAQRKRA